MSGMSGDDSKRRSSWPRSAHENEGSGTIEIDDEFAAVTVPPWEVARNAGAIGLLRTHARAPSFIDDNHFIFECTCVLCGERALQGADAYSS
jgi:hypothetical protein